MSNRNQPAGHLEPSLVREAVPVRGYMQYVGRRAMHALKCIMDMAYRVRYTAAWTTRLRIA